MFTLNLRTTFPASVDSTTASSAVVIKGRVIDKGLPVITFLHKWRLHNVDIGGWLAPAKTTARGAGSGVFKRQTECAAVRRCKLFPGGRPIHRWEVRY